MQKCPSHLQWNFSRHFWICLEFFIKWPQNKLYEPKRKIENMNRLHKLVNCLLWRLRAVQWLIEQYHKHPETVDWNSAIMSVNCIDHRKVRNFRRRICGFCECAGVTLAYCAQKNDSFNKFHAKSTSIDKLPGPNPWNFANAPTSLFLSSQRGHFFSFKLRSAPPSDLVHCSHHTNCQDAWPKASQINQKLLPFCADAAP